MSQTSTLNLGGSKEVKISGLTRMAPETCKSVRGLKVSDQCLCGEFVRSENEA